MVWDFIQSGQSLPHQAIPGNLTGRIKVEALRLTGLY